MGSKSQLPSFDRVLGTAVRRLRDERRWRQEDLARRAQLSAGLDWDRDTVAAIERGTRRVSASELIMLPLVFEVELHELFTEEDDVRVAKDATTRVSAIRHVLKGEFHKVGAGTFETPETRGPRSVLSSALKISDEQVQNYKALWPKGTLDGYRRAEAAAQGVAEQKAAAKLKIDARHVSVAAFGLWGKSLSDERDERLKAHAVEGASPRTLQALRGHITRELLTLIDELEKAIAAK